MAAKGCLPAHPDSVNILGRDFAGGQMARDMNLFVDDDGTAYHIYASEENSTLHISKLTPDYLSCSGEYIRAFTGRYMEAPAMFKHDGKYYLIASDCTGWAPNAARSATADSILGEWSELGNPCEGEGADLTFHSQSTYILPMPGRAGEFIFMADPMVSRKMPSMADIFGCLSLSKRAGRLSGGATIGICPRAYLEWDIDKIKMDCSFEKGVRVQKTVLFSNTFLVKW